MRGVALLIILGLFCFGIYLVSQADPAVNPGVQSSQPQRRDTPRPGLYELVLGAMDAQSTAAAANRAARDAGNTANQYYAAATARAAEATAQSGQEYLDQTAAAAEITARAGQTVTAQAWAVIGWTATADVDRSTAQAGQTAIAVGYTQTAVVHDIQQTQVAGEYLANTLRRAAEREEATNKLLGWLPFALTILAALSILVVGSLWVIKYYRAPVVIPRDARGDIGVMATNAGDLVDMDRNPNGILSAGKSRLASPAFVDPESQERLVSRDQIIDWNTRGLPGQAQGAPRSARSAPPKLAAGPQYKIYIEPQQPPALLADPETMKALDGQWREAK